MVNKIKNHLMNLGKYALGGALVIYGSAVFLDQTCPRTSLKADVLRKADTNGNGKLSRLEWDLCNEGLGTNHSYSEYHGHYPPRAFSCQYRAYLKKE